MSDRSRKILPWLTLLAGLVLLVFYVGARIDGEAGRRAELAKFEQARVGLATAAATSILAAENPEARAPAPGVDQSLWSESRIAHYRESLDRRFDPPLGVLRIPRIGLEVPVLPGTDELTLNRAVGHVAGTALPGRPGNVAVAGHRDGFFRGLKDLDIGDRLELETLDVKQGFVVTGLTVVTPADVQVLEPTAAPTLTLVTCYPFYFVGDAPQRFIVRAELDQESSAAQAETGAAEDGPPP